jgi:hypothetical protein
VCRLDGGTRAYRDVFTACSGKPIPDRVPLQSGSIKKGLSNSRENVAHFYSHVRGPLRAAGQPRSVT